MRQFERALKALSRYYQDPILSLPVAVYEDNNHKVRFVYAHCTARAFVKRYGSAADFAVIEQSLCSRRFKSVVGKKAPLEWTLGESEEPQKGLVASAFTLSAPKWSKQVVHSTQRGHQTEVTTSLNRSVQTLLGTTPKLRREHYATVARNSRFPWRDSPRKPEWELRFVPEGPIALEMSALIMDGHPGRIVANAHFSATG